MVFASCQALSQPTCLHLWCQRERDREGEGEGKRAIISVQAIIEHSTTTAQEWRTWSYANSAARTPNLNILAYFLTGSIRFEFMLLTRAGWGDQPSKGRGG